MNRTGLAAFTEGPALAAGVDLLEAITHDG
jgi:hypothetical protein